MHLFEVKALLEEKKLDYQSELCSWLLHPWLHVLFWSCNPEVTEFASWNKEYISNWLLINSTTSDPLIVSEKKNYRRTFQKYYNSRHLFRIRGSIFVAEVDIINLLVMLGDSSIRYGLTGYIFNLYLNIAIKANCISISHAWRSLWKVQMNKTTQVVSTALEQKISHLLSSGWSMEIWGTSRNILTWWWPSYDLLITSEHSLLLLGKDVTDSWKHHSSYVDVLSKWIYI